MRLFIGTLAFLCVTTAIGLHMRAGHQLFYSLFVIVLFALLVRNVWLTLFIWLSCLLFAISKFQYGQIYITNIFYGSVLYYITKLAFEKRHIDFFIKMVLWVVFVNLCYGILQALNFDFIYLLSEELKFTNIPVTPSPNGFMGNSGIAACLYCLAIPFMATRSRNSIWLSFIMLIPICILRSSISLFAAFVIILFLLWFKINRRAWISIFILFILAGITYLMYFDLPGVERFVLWKEMLRDANCHPILGWGMDTFRKFTALKPYIFVEATSKWDNPHNLYISLFYEFGFLSLFILGGYLRQRCIAFKGALKDMNTLALTGFALGFFVISLASFPIFLARTACIIIPALALWEVSTNG